MTLFTLKVPSERDAVVAIKRISLGLFECVVMFRDLYLIIILLTTNAASISVFHNIISIRRLYGMLLTDRQCNLDSETVPGTIFDILSTPDVELQWSFC